MTAALRFESVTAGYGPITVLDEASLAMGPDEVLVVLGANGSGKSTVLKTAIGLTRLSAGRIMLGECDISVLSPHRRAEAGMGYVPQTRNVFADLSVNDNLRMGGFLHAAGLTRDMEQVFDLFPRLRERRRERAGDLSGGERRMLSIGLTLLLRPRMLLLDEPSSDLSPAMITAVFDAIRQIRVETRIPVLLVEQNLQAGLSLADRVCVMVRGRVALEQAAQELNREQLHALFLEGGVRLS
ncbi:ABC transporter ATP-binding protein [Acidisoma silvae]|uniref:ATP-binding cassette domain-containing protein n=1 Tax=Acidisoma silvae TaxID=2802396 RepID=A0A963YVU0_9PROT|nr:ATP-binding cassette domain-containing protein [Acidisoma silvae]MCB8878061.1 ATP-binding cassette domain-containing protein [Acidisoma silvae]